MCLCWLTADCVLCTAQSAPHLFLSQETSSTLPPRDSEKASPSVSRDSTHTTSVLCQSQFSRCWWGRLTLILSVTMFSNYHSLRTNMIAWLAALFPWQLLWFWLCQSFHPLLHVASNSSSTSRSLFLLPLMCVMAVWGIFSLFTVEKLFKNSCSAPLQCYYLWAQ